MIDILNVMDEKRYLLSELDAGRIDRERWRDFIAYARSAGCPAMAADMQRRLEAYTRNMEHQRIVSDYYLDKVKAAAA